MRCSFLLASSALLLAACASGGPSGGNRNAPDEFAVLTKPPLTVPPDYALRPPRPGETRPQELSTSERTQQLLLGDQTKAPPSNGELAFIQLVGAVNVDPSIRAILAAENGGQADKDASLSNRLIFWRYNNGAVDDSAAPLVVDDREAWFAQRQRSVDSVTGVGASVTIASDDKNVLALPGVQ
ncbi:MAG: DUF3035 domain-containing protein [Pseudomonadota bacterium]